MPKGCENVGVCVYMTRHVWCEAGNRNHGTTLIAPFYFFTRAEEASAELITGVAESLHGAAQDKHAHLL